MNAVSTSGCRNCDAPLADGQRFCGACGQRVVHGRLTFGEIAHDFLHALTHADRSVFALVTALLVKPGRVARDYVEGRRKRWFGPFAFLVISVGLASFMSYVVGVEWFTPVPHEAGREILSRHFNLVILVQTPLIAMFCKLLLWGSKLHFSEHLVLASYVCGMRSLFLAFVEAPLHLFLDIPASSAWIVVPYLVLWLGYFAFAAAQFYGGRRWLVAIKAMLSGVLAQGATSMLIFVFIFLLYRFGGP